MVYSVYGVYIMNKKLIMKKILDDLIMLIFRRGFYLGLGLAMIISAFFTMPLLLGAVEFMLGCVLVYVAFRDSNHE